MDDAEAMATSREVARREGIFVGISSGAALQAALQLAARPRMAGKRLVVMRLHRYWKLGHRVIEIYRLP